MPEPPFPYPGTPAFRDLTPQEQEWLVFIEPWYGRAITAIHPSRAFDHPLMADIRSHPEVHLPMFLRFYRKDPLVFGIVLKELTGGKTRGKTPAECHKNWKKVVAAYLKTHPKKAAAE